MVTEDLIQVGDNICIHVHALEHNCVHIILHTFLFMRPMVHEEEFS